MKAIFGIIGVAAFAIATSVGFAQLQAATNPLLDYCPATPASDAGTCVVAANMMLSVGNPNDDALIAAINAIAGQVQNGHVRGAACADAAAGMGVLAAAIGDASTRAMAEALSAALCGGSLGVGAESGAAPLLLPTNSLSTPVSSGCVRVASNSSGGTSGNTSGGTSGSSGTSGQSSGSSGSSGQSSGQSATTC